jgi:hypothetical protein
MKPPPTALRSRSRSRDDQVHARLWSKRCAVLVVAQIEPVAEVPSTSPQRLEFLRVVRLLVEHVGQELHVEPGDLEAELPRVGMTCARAVSMPIESWPKMTTRRPLSACVVTAA